MSETPAANKPGKILAAMNKVQDSLSRSGIGKDRNNTQQNYKFRGIDDVYNAISGLFADNKVLVVPHYTDVVQTERESGLGKAIFVTRLNGQFDFVSAEDGTVIAAGPFPGEAMDSADKSTNKAMSAAFKYALMQVFTIPTEGDNDADATTHEVRGRQADEKPARQIEKGQPENRSAEDDDRHYGNDQMARAPLPDSPLTAELDKLLGGYGKGRKAAEKKIAEAMGVESLAKLPVERVPEAITKVLTHQKAAAARKTSAPSAPQPDRGGVTGPIDDGKLPW